MQPTDFSEANCCLAKPPGMTDEECQPLPAHRTQDGRWISRWQPTDAERAAIAAGAPVWLHVFAAGHPPVALTAETPFRTEGGGDAS